MKKPSLLLLLMLLSVHQVTLAELQVGEPAPHLQAKDVYGHTLDSIKLSQSKPVYILFFEPWMPAGLDNSVALFQKYKEHVAFIGVSPAMNSSKANVKYIAKTHNVKFPVVFDETNSTLRLFKSWNQPTQILIDGDGKIAFYSQQADADIESAIQQLIQEKS